MPANLPPQYYEAEKVYRQARSAAEKAEALEAMLAIMPKHKGTEHLRGDLRARLAKLQVEGERKSGATRSQLNSVPWPEDFVLGEDFSFSLLNAAFGPMLYVHQPLCVITRHDSNMSLDERRMAVSDIDVLNWALAGDAFSPERNATIRRSLGSRLAGLGRSYRRDNRLESLKCYARALRYPGARLKSLKGLVRTLIPY